MMPKMTDVSTYLAKPALRASLKETLRRTTDSQRSEWSSAIRDYLMRDTEWIAQNAGRGVVALFGGLPFEPDLWPLVPWLQERGWHAALFVVRKDRMEPYLVREREHITRGVFGIWEPQISLERQVDPLHVSTLLVPGLGFGAEDGGRVGRGGGYYDRFLGEECPLARRIAVGFEAQVLPRVPMDPFDMPMDRLLTEKGWRTFTRPGPPTAK